MAVGFVKTALVTLPLGRKTRSKTPTAFLLLRGEELWNQVLSEPGEVSRVARGNSPNAHTSSLSLDSPGFSYF